MMRLQVPFTDVRSGIARGLQGLRQSHIFGRHIANYLRWLELMARPMSTAIAAVVRQSDSARIFTRQILARVGEQTGLAA